MINITYSQEKKQIECSGHAGYAAAGSDIVCAAVSAVMRMVCYAAVSESDRHKVTVKDNKISVILAPDQGGKAEAVLECAAANLAKIAQEYPDYTCMFLK